MSLSSIAVRFYFPGAAELLESAPPRGYLLETPKSEEVFQLASLRATPRFLRVILVFFLLNVVSAALFIRFVNRPVYDDQYNISDVHTYATKGVSVSSIRENKNPPGPTSFVWMSATVRVLGGNELKDARIGALLSWILLACGVLVGARYTQFPELWYGALLASLLFPHSVESAALVLTEGPALLFAILGAMAWVEFVSWSELNARSLLLGISGGFSMGIAVTCRQYFLALLPAAFLLAVYQTIKCAPRLGRRWYVGLFLSLAAAALPVLTLVLIWKGLSSPGIASGASYQNWRSSIGVDFGRPLIAAFYAAVYFMPLTIPAVFWLKTISRRRIILVALCGGLLAGCFRGALLQPGPLRSVIHFVVRRTFPQSIVLGAVAAVAIYAAIATLALLWQCGRRLLLRPPVMFAMLTVAFFIVEQCGVGGNIPFYDRYMIQMAPFLGLAAFATFPRMTPSRVSVLAALALIGQVMLWRFA